MRTTLSSILLMLVGLGQWSWSAEISASKRVAPVVIDGNLDEADWQTAPEHGDFVLLQSKGGSKPQVDTTFKVLADSQALYFGIVCREPNMKELSGGSADRDASEWVSDDIELFIDPAGRGVSYYQFVVRPNGGQFDGHWIENGNTTSGHYSGLWQSAVKKNADSWVLEICLPLSAFYLTPSEEFAPTWKLNLSRMRRQTWETSSWSKLEKSFHESDRFGTLVGVPKKPRTLDVHFPNAVAKITSLDKQTHSGSLELALVAGQGVQGSYLLSVTEGKRTVWPEQSVNIAQGDQTLKLTGVTFEGANRHLLKFVLKDGQGKLVTGMEQEVPVVYRPLAVQIDEPFYGKCIFPGQKVDRIAGVVKVNCPTEGAELSVVFKNGEKILGQQKPDIKDKEARFNFDATALLEGEYMLEITLKRGEKIEAQTGELIRKLSAPTEGTFVYIDRDLNLVKDGQPMLVRGWYGNSSYAMSTAMRNRYNGKPAGKFVNAWECQIGMEGGRIDKSDASRETKDVQPSQMIYDEMAKRCAQATKAKNVLWYYLSDEPECRGISPIYLKYQYDFIKKHDPYHPVLIVTRDPERFTDCADILSTHTYIAPVNLPDGSRKLTNPVSFARKLTNAILREGKERIPAWSTPQAFSYSSLGNKLADFPTYNEYQASVWCALVNGAKGFLPFMYSDHFASPDLRIGCDYVYETMAAVEPMLQHGKRTMIKTNLPEHVDAALWMRQGKSFVAVINLTDKPQKVEMELSQLGDGKLPVIAGEGSISVKSGRVELGLHPYEVCLFGSQGVAVTMRTQAMVRKEIAKFREEIKKPGNLFYHQAKNIDWKFSEGSASRADDLTDGLDDVQGWVNSKAGDGAWCEMTVPKLSETIGRIRLNSATIEQATISKMADGKWIQIGQAKAVDGVLEFVLSEPMAACKLKIDATNVKRGARAEIYEVEAYSAIKPCHADTGMDELSASSPDGKLILKAALDASGDLRYTFMADGKMLVNPSLMGMDFGPAGKTPSANWKITETATRTLDQVWKPLWGKRASVPDKFSEVTCTLRGEAAPFDRLRVILRAYDDGVAFRYEIPADAKGEAAAAKSDRTEFHFSGDFTAWFYNGENHNLGPDPLSAVTGERLPLMVLKASENSYLAVHEADLRSGEPMRLSKMAPSGFSLLAAPGKIMPGYVSPWRVIFFGRSPGAMVDSHLLELLNPPPSGDFSWVKPGVAVWDWRINGAEVADFKYTMTLPSWIRMVDFAAANHIKHLVLDADWYGPEFGKDSDPVKGDKAGDVRKLIAYGKTKNIGIWLYLNDVGGRQFPLEDTLKQYGEWGASGVKYGFMKGSPEEKNIRTRMITELCAKNKLLCDFHDGPVHPYGQMRTWPNAVTREFCFAQLDAKRVFQPKTFVSAVFVNMLAGPLDMNNGFFDLRQGKTTRVDNPMECPSTLVAEAARTLITFSGITILPDIPEFYQKYPDLLAFLSAQKMPWKESKTLSGAIGEHIVMARQAADGTWLIGAATNEIARELEIKLDFLPPGKFDALIVQDGPDADYQKNRETLQSERRKVSAGDTLRVKLAPGGGACVILKIRDP